jgi:hypothetical protein
VDDVWGISGVGAMGLGGITRVLAVALAVALVQGKAAAKASDYRFIEYKETIVVEDDGSFVAERTVIKSPLTRSAIDWIGQADLSYSQNLAELDVLEAYVLKAGKQRIDVPPDAIKLQDDAISDGAPMFTDEKHKIIVFPDIDIDDELVYRARLTQRVAYFPGHFVDMWYFPPDIEVGKARVEISMPADLDLQVEVLGFKAEAERRSGNRVIRAWTYEKREPEYINGSYAVDARDYAARLNVSTMKSYAELAAAYEARAAEKAAVTDEIRSLALSLTEDVDDRREKARKLYEWVNLNIRYVATYIGAGGYVPHAAADVLRNRYGDCKDHVVLLEALLEAVGIESSAAIINSDNAYLIPGVPSVSPFDHAITYLPEFDLYADSTNFLMPFGVLGSRLADKPVVVTKLTEDPIRRTPPNDAFKAGSFVSTVARIHSDGSVTGTAKAKLYGAYSDWIRSTIVDASDDQLAEWSTSWMNDTGLQGTSRMTVDDPFALGDPFNVSGEFSTGALLDLSMPGAFPIPESHFASYSFSGIANGALEASRDVNVKCGAIGLREQIRIELPPEIEIFSLPPNVEEKAGVVQYRATYTKDATSITIDRELVDQSPHGQCTPDETADQAKIATVVNRDLRRMVLFKPAPGL